MLSRSVRMFGPAISCGVEQPASRFRVVQVCSRYARCRDRYIECLRPLVAAQAHDRLRRPLWHRASESYAVNPMKLTAKTEYALLAMLQLAADYELGDPVQIRAIADEHGIPSRFLVQILLQLKSAALVTSTRGAAGGYRLARPPREISLAEVIDAIEGGDRPESCAAKPTPLARAVLDLCHELDAIRRQRLEATSLADLVELAAAREPMWYI